MKYGKKPAQIYNTFCNFATKLLQSYEESVKFFRLMDGKVKV